MILFRLLSWPYLRKHILRSLLTLAGIILGVAVFVAGNAVNQAVLYGFQHTVDRIAGAAQLQVSAGEAGFDEQVLERVQSLEEVRVAVPVIEAVAETGLKGQGNLLILGVDLTGDRSLREYDLESGDEAVIDDPLVFLAQPDSLMVAAEFAQRNHLTINSRIPLRTMDGRKEFTVRGIMSSHGFAGAFGGNLAVMDIYAAQKMFGRGRKFDRIDLAVKEDVSVEQCQAALQKMLGPGFEVEPPAARGQHFERMTRAYSILVNITSLFALLAGLFIIYNSFAIAVTQRRSEIGILRALGATRGQVRAMFLGESAIAGLAGSALGIAFGMLLARAGVAYVEAAAQSIMGVAQRAEEVSADPRLAAFALAVGVLTSMAGAVIPARNAARVDPVRALQKGKYQVLSAGENRLRQRVAAVFAAGAAVCLFFGRFLSIFYAGYLLTLLAALLLTPTLALWLARVLRPALKRLRPVEGALAADSLIQAPRRTSATVVGLMLSLAIVVAIAGYARAGYRSIVDWMHNTLNPDLFVVPTEDLAQRYFHFPASLGVELERVEGVAEVQRLHAGRVLFRGVSVMLVSTELAKLDQRVHPRVIAGRREEMFRLAGEGKGVIVSENFAGLQHVGLGDVLELAAPGGMLRLPVVGITRDYSDPFGAILMDRGLFQRAWKDDTVNLFRIYLQPGASPAEVKQRILERFAGERRLFVMTNRDLWKYILHVFDQAFALTYMQLAVAVMVAVLGIANTLMVSITDRRRELGVLQAVGGLRRQVRHTVWMEALSIGMIGLVLGLALGGVTLYYWLEMIHRIGGLRLDYEFPREMGLYLVPLILGCAFLSALWPAEAAVRGSLVEALEYE